jgi:hypothetical protein
MTENWVLNVYSVLFNKLLMIAEMEFLLDPLSPNGGEG